MQPDSPWRSCGIPEGFTQIIETPTSRIDEVIVLIRELCTRLDDGRPAAPRGTLTAGRIGAGSLLTDGAGPEAALGPGAVSSDVGRDESLADLHTLSTPAKPPGPVSRRRPSCVPPHRAGLAHHHPGAHAEESARAPRLAVPWEDEQKSTTASAPAAGTAV